MRSSEPKPLRIVPLRPEPPTEPAYLRHPLFEKEREQLLLRRKGERFRRRSVFAQLGIFACILLLWPLPIINPIKLLVVLFHEFSHMMMAYITGGVVFGLAIDPGGAGITLGMHGNELAVLLAGYLGSFAIGALLYALSAVWEPGDVWGVLTVLCCLSLLFGWLNGFTALFGYGALAILVWGFFRFTEHLQKLLIRVVATTCCLYPILDIWGELSAGARNDGFILQGRLVGSDMARLAEMTGLSMGALSFAFIAPSLVAVVFLVDWSARKDAATLVKSSIIPFGRRRALPTNTYRPNDPASVPRYRVR